MSGNGALVRVAFTSGIFKGYISAADSEDQFIACDDDGPDIGCEDLDDVPDISPGGDSTKHPFYLYDDLICYSWAAGTERSSGPAGIEDVIFTTGPPAQTGFYTVKPAAPEIMTHNDNIPPSITSEYFQYDTVKIIPSQITSPSLSFYITDNKTSETTRYSNNTLIDFHNFCEWNIKSRPASSLSIQRQEGLLCLKNYYAC